MSYDYSKAFLEANVETVRQLTALTKTREVLVYRDTDAAALRKIRFFFNNVLASMALYEPDLEHVRKQIRTWVEMDRSANVWVLYVGIPQQKLRGNSKSQMLFGARIAGIMPSTQVADTLVVTDHFTVSNFLNMFDHVMKAAKDDNTQRITFQSMNLPMWERNENFVAFLKGVKQVYGFIPGRIGDASGNLTQLELVRIPKAQTQSGP